MMINILILLSKLCSLKFSKVIGHFSFFIKNITLSLGSLSIKVRMLFIQFKFRNNYHFLRSSLINLTFQIILYISSFVL